MRKGVKKWQTAFDPKRTLNGWQETAAEEVI